LLAPDPRFYIQGQLNSGNVGVLSGGGFIVPAILPVTSSHGTGGTVTMTNSGSTDTHPTLTLTGPLTNPYVQNRTTGYAFQLDYTIPGGVSVVIDMYGRTVVYGGNTNFIQYVDPLSTWWTLIEGDNTISLTTASASDTGYMSLTAYSAVQGL
jgi:hypothetical protein